MKKRNFFLGLSMLFLLASCGGGNTIHDDNNHDDDITDDVTTDGEDNSFDELVTHDEEVEIPETYKEYVSGAITEAGNYYLKGDYDTVDITTKNIEVFIFLDGVNITSSTSYAFGSSKAITLHLVLLNDSVNTISNDVLDTNAFHVKGNVYISGKGTLNITSKQKNGLKVSKDLFVYEGVTLNVTGYNHAITARSIVSKGASISVISETKDGLQLECDSDITAYTKDQGFAYLKDTKFTSDTYGDGIQADTYVYISGGEYDITTHGEFVPYSTTNMSTYGLERDDFKYVKSGSDYKRVAADEIRQLSSSYYALANSVKGIKVGPIEVDTDNDDVDDLTVTTGEYEVYIAHLASLTINSFDDCVHTNYGKTTVDSANLILSTYDDGLHADYDLLVNNSSISVNKSYEGLEGATITINGANTNIIANSEDDGINAASDLSSTNTITINDGYIRVFASGDGLDANTALYLNGGTVIVEGPGRQNGSLDSDNIYFNSGTIFACSTNGMTERMSATQYTFVYSGSTIAANTKVSVVDSNNNALFSYTLKQSCSQIIFSHKDMKKGQSYKVVAGSTTLATITMTSTLVTSGSSSGGGPGGGGHGPGGW